MSRSIHRTSGGSLVTARSAEDRADLVVRVGERLEDQDDVVGLVNAPK